MWWRNILPAYLVHALNVKYILCNINYMIINNIPNRTPKSGILFTGICIGDIVEIGDIGEIMSSTNMILWSIELNLCFTTIICEQKFDQAVDTSDCERREDTEGILAERREAPFGIYFLTIRIMCYVKIWKYIIALCLFVLYRGFLTKKNVSKMKSMQQNEVDTAKWSRNEVDTAK